MEPDEVEYKAHIKGGSRRRPKLTYEQLQERAEEQGVGEIYTKAVKLLRPHFEKTRTTRSSISFVADFNGSRSAMLNLIPLDSSPESGLAFQAYSLRLADRFRLSEQALLTTLPEGTQEWEYYSDAPVEWRGHQGYFRTVTELECLISSWTDAVPGSV